MPIDGTARHNATHGCEVSLTNRLTGYVVRGAACWFHYRDGTHWLDDRSTELHPDETLQFRSDKPELGVEMVIVVANVCRGIHCMRVNYSDQAWPGHSLVKCDFAVKLWNKKNRTARGPEGLPQPRQACLGPDTHS